MSKLGFRHNGLFTALALSLPARLGDLTPQHVSNIMYSFGKLGHRDDALLTAICDHVPSRLWEFRPQNIANTVYATGKLGFYHHPLLSAVASHLPYRLTECVSQDISNIIYSFGLLGFRNDEFLIAVREYVVGELVPSGIMQQKDLSYLASAFRKCGMDINAVGEPSSLTSGYDGSGQWTSVPPSTTAETPTIYSEDSGVRTNPTEQSNMADIEKLLDAINMAALG
jgi:hypothetical protein